jgi:hypothetical protein
MAAKPASFLWSEGAGILTTLSRIYRGQPSLGKSALELRLARIISTTHVDPVAGRVVIWRQAGAKIKRSLALLKKILPYSA